MADIGSGTGKFAKQLLDRGSVVYCMTNKTVVYIGTID